MAEVVNRKHGRRRMPTETKRGIQPYVILNVVLVIGLVIAAFALAGSAERGFVPILLAAPQWQDNPQVDCTESVLPGGRN